jgi:hypothetical protein
MTRQVSHGLVEMIKKINLNCQSATLCASLSEADGFHLDFKVGINSTLQLLSSTITARHVDRSGVN